MAYQHIPIALLVWNVWITSTTGYLPLTVFYLVTIIFRISANLGLLVGYVKVCQMIITYNLIQVYMTIDSKDKETYIMLKMITIFYFIWNFDFFHTLYSSFCLHPNMSAVGIFSLDYMVSIYPMASLFIIYFVVQKFSYVICLCRPLYKYLHLIKKELKFRNSLIDAFATLLHLSSVKIFNVTFNILPSIYLS